MTKTEIINKIIELKPSYYVNKGILHNKTLKELEEELKKVNKMKFFNNKEFFELLIEEYGDKQVIVAIEELSELQKELCKYLRGKTNIDNVIEEMADVYIMFQQMQLFFKIDNERLIEEVNKKVKRTKERLFNN